MRKLSSAALLLVAIFLFGCAHEKTASAQYAEFSGTPAVAPNRTPSPTPSTAPEPASGQKLIVTPTDGLNGKVSKVNANLRFVVLTFPVGQMPDLNRRMNLYRQGLKVGEVNITGPQRNDSVVADVTAGEAEPGDEVRDR